MNPLGNNGARRRGNDAFYGQDSGTVFNGGAQEDMEKDRNAQSDEERQAEEEEFSKETGRWSGKYKNDSAKFWRFMAHMDRRENGEPEPAKPQEPKEEPFLSRAADDKFWGDKDELTRVGKQVRPRL